MDGLVIDINRNYKIQKKSINIYDAQPWGQPTVSSDSNLRQYHLNLTVLSATEKFFKLQPL